MPQNATGNNNLNKILVSACLAGIDCRYDGGHCLDE